MKRIIAFFLSALLLAAVLPLYICADGEKSTSYYTIPIMEKKHWEAKEGTSAISGRRTSKGSTIYASAKEETGSVAFCATFSPIDLTDYNELSLDLSMNGDSDKFTAKITIVSEGQSFTQTVKSKAKSETFYIPISQDIRPSLSGIDIEITTDGGNISYVTVASIIADDTFTYSYLSRFMAKDIQSNSFITKEENKVILNSGDGTGIITPVFDTLPENGREMLVWITLEKATTGTIHIEAKYPRENPETQEKTVIKTHGVAAYEGTVSFVLQSGYSEVSFVFSNASTSAPVNIIGAGYADMGKSEENAGDITSCRYDGKKMNVSGSLSTEASLKYMGSKLLLYMIPITEASSFDVTKAEPVASAGFSTKFTLSFDFDSTYAKYFYKVILDTSDGLIPVGDMTAAACSAQSYTAQDSMFAISGVQTADVFDTYASSVILPVAVGKLFETDDPYSSPTYTYDTTYRFNANLLSQLDDSISFYTAAGIDVYLRIYSDKEGYIFDYSPDSEDSLSIMCTAAGFLSERYPSLLGFIMGDALRAPLSTTPESCEKNARLICAFTECVKSKNSSCRVLIPYSTESQTDARLRAAMLSFYLEKYGSHATAALFETSDQGTASVSTAHNLSILISHFGAGSDGCAVLWKVPSSASVQDITNNSRDLCIMGTTYKINFAAIDLSNVEKSSKLFDSIKSMLDSSNIINETVSKFKASTQSEEFTGSFPLWDFTSAYDTKGWICGGGFSSPISDRGTFGGRVLSAKATEGSTDAGILIGSFSAPVDMTDCALRLSLAVFSEESKEANVTVILGSGDLRAEFSSVLPCNEKGELICDLSALSGETKIDYAAVIVRDVTDGQAEISKAELCSQKLTDEEMEAKYKTDNGQEPKPLLYVAVIFMAALTVTVFSILMRSKKKKQ